MAACLDLDQFFDEPTWEQLEGCRKVDLETIATHINMNVTKLILERDL